MSYNYENYKREYAKQKAEQEASGYKMFSPMMGKRQYEATAKATENTYLDEINAGTRESVGDIDKALVEDQRFVSSEKQAKAWEKAIEIHNEKHPEEIVAMNFYDLRQIDLYRPVDPRLDPITKEMEKEKEAYEKKQFEKYQLTHPFAKITDKKKPWMASVHKYISHLYYGSP